PLLVFVGSLGSWLLGLIPTAGRAVIPGYMAPWVLGGVLIQAMACQKAPRTTVVAFVLATLMTFVLIPMFPSLGFYGPFIVVFATAGIAWLVRPRGDVESNPVAEAHGEDPTQE